MGAVVVAGLALAGVAPILAAPANMTTISKAAAEIEPGHASALLVHLAWMARLLPSVAVRVMPRRHSRGWFRTVGTVFR